MLVTLVRVALVVGIALLVVALGFTVTWRDATMLFRQPMLLARCMLAMNVLVPVVALALALHFGLDGPVKIALVSMAVSPMPPFLPGREVTVGGTPAFVVGLLVASAVLAVALVPATLAVMGYVIGRPLEVPILKIASTIAVTVALPLVIGVVLRSLAPKFAERVRRGLGGTAAVLLLFGLAIIFVALSAGMWTLIGDGTLAAMVALAVAALAIGHVCGGRPLGQRAALALTCASRHPGVAIGIVSTSFPGQARMLPAILLYAIVSMIVSTPYAMWMRHRIIEARDDRAATND